MATPTWQPGTLYPRGSLVQPLTAPTARSPQVENGDFAQGAGNWDYEGGIGYSTTGGYQGNGGSARLPGNLPEGVAVNRTKLFMPVGTEVAASAMIQQGASIKGATRGWVELRFYSEDDVEIQRDQGNIVDDGSGGAWNKSETKTKMPNGGSYARAAIHLFSVADHNHPIWGDNLSISTSYSGIPEGLVYRAVQPKLGTSAANEPAWPPVLGQQVTDNEVIWEAVQANRIVYKARPIMKTGDIEPTWPQAEGSYTADGTVNWRASSRRIEDPKCPNSPIMIIMAGHVYMADDDIAPYSAVNNPLDWSTPNDAGFLPVNMNLLGSNPIRGFGPYRSNLAIMNAEGFQMWQVDEDPALSSFLDALPLGSTEHWAITPMGSDLYFLSSEGVRSISIAAASTNLDAGDVGAPIDPLIMHDYRAAQSAGFRPKAIYHPGLGQVWMWFNVPGVHEVPAIGSYASRVFVYTVSKTSKVNGWSYYTFPFQIDEVAIDENVMVIRTGDKILELDEMAFRDDVPASTEEGLGFDFAGLVWWPYLDFGSPGVDKNLQYLDLVSDGSCDIEFGYNQNDRAAFTEPYPMLADTVPGDFVPYEMTAPSISVRLTYNPDQLAAWKFYALNLYIEGRR